MYKSQKPKRSFATMTYREILLKDDIEARNAVRIKRTIKNRIMDEIEARLAKKTIQNRAKSIAHIIERTGRECRYQTKVQFIESSIEKNIKYMRNKGIL